MTANPFVTKGDLTAAVEALKTDSQKQMHELKVSLIQWMIGVQLAYGAIIVGVLLTNV